MFTENEYNFRKKILVNLYRVLAALVAILGIINYQTTKNVIATIMFAITAVILVLSVLFASKNKLTAANHLAILSLSAAIITIQLMSPVSYYNLIGLVLPILLAGLLEVPWFTIAFTTLMNSIVILLFLIQKSFTLEYCIAIVAVFTISSAILFYHRRYENHIESTRYQLLNQTIEVAIFILGYTTELRDENTGKHIERVGRTSVLVAETMKKTSRYSHYLTKAYISDLEKASTLHDIGKVTIPDKILLKPGKLSSEEFDVIKTHTLKGADIIKIAKAKIDEQTVFTMAEQITRSHHERWDGNGYPDGLKTDKIPLSAQIVAVADVYDALASKRCYKEKFPHNKCVKIISSESGKQFAPEVVTAFLNIEKQIEVLYK